MPNLYTSEFLLSIKDPDELKDRLINDFNAPSSKDHSLIFQAITTPAGVTTSYLSYLISGNQLALIQAVNEFILENQAVLQQLNKITGENFIHAAAQYATADLFDLLQPIMNLALHTHPALMFERSTLGTPLRVAVQRKNTQMTEYLLNTFCERHSELPGHLITTAFESLFKNLYEAAAENQFSDASRQILRLLFKYGVPLFADITEEKMQQVYINLNPSEARCPLVDFEIFKSSIESDTLISNENYWRALLSQALPLCLDSPELKDKKCARMLISLSGADTLSYTNRIIQENIALLSDMENFLNAQSKTLNADEAAAKRTAFNGLRSMLEALLNIDEKASDTIKAFKILDLTGYVTWSCFTYVFKSENKRLYEKLINQYSELMFEWTYDPLTQTNIKEGPLSQNCWRMPSDFLRENDDEKFGNLYEACYGFYSDYTASVVLLPIIAAGFIVGYYRSRDLSSVQVLDIGFYTKLLLHTVQIPSQLISTYYLKNYNSTTDVNDKVQIIHVLKEQVEIFSALFKNEADQKILKEIYELYLSKSMETITRADLIQVMERLKPFIVKYKSYAQWIPQELVLSSDAKNTLSNLPQIPAQNRWQCLPSWMSAWLPHQRPQTGDLNQRLIERQMQSMNPV